MKFLKRANTIDSNKKNILLAKKKIKNKKSRQIFMKQIENFDKCNHYYQLPKHQYKVGDFVFLKKGTLLHGTYKNLEGLKNIVENGLISSWFNNGRHSKYPSSVGLWNLKKDYYLKDYINFYSGGTICYKKMDGSKINTAVIPYDEMPNMINTIDINVCGRWYMEQTKEARFLPSLVQNDVQVGIIFHGDNELVQELLKGDILKLDISDEDVRPFVNPYYYKKFIIERKKKDDFFTDRESAILFGIPSCFIEGVLVGRKYENDDTILSEIKTILPNVFICNLDGKVIVESTKKMNVHSPFLLVFNKKT